MVILWESRKQSLSWFIGEAIALRFLTLIWSSVRVSACCRFTYTPHKPSALALSSAVDFRKLGMSFMKKIEQLCYSEEFGFQTVFDWSKRTERERLCVIDFTQSQLRPEWEAACSYCDVGESLQRKWKEKKNNIKLSKWKNKNFMTHSRVSAHLCSHCKKSIFTSVSGDVCFSSLSPKKGSRPDHRVTPLVWTAAAHVCNFHHTPASLCWCEPLSQSQGASTRRHCSSTLIILFVCVGHMLS